MASTNDNSSDSENERFLEKSEHHSTSSMSSASSAIEGPRNAAQRPDSRLFGDLADLYSGSVAAKIWRFAQELLEKDNTLQEYPEFVPREGPSAGRFSMKPAQFWTCGFFPGSLYCILERCVKFPKSIPLPPSIRTTDLLPGLLDLCRTWAGPLHQMAKRTNTHDLGFITQPALRMDWELTGNNDSFRSLVTAAQNLACRWSDEVGAIRSWDRAVSHAYNIVDKEKNFLIIVDSMCNMDLLFYVGHHIGDQSLIDKATVHARTVLRTLVRKDFSMFHVANLDPHTGKVQKQFTHQGYSDSSTWARGQAWAILGFVQTYAWTRDAEFLDAAIRLSELFLTRLSKCTQENPNVPPWDFDAPAGESVLRDSSAGMIAANGMLLLHQILSTQSVLAGPNHQTPAPQRYLKAVMEILRDTLAHCLHPISDHDTVRFQIDGSRISTTSSSQLPDRWDAILAHATANNNENALVRYSDHGLVYADYYFLELGNKLLRMGLV
ncbi:hypothetical protein H2200_009295 [Cladophialophora chaetospira]|uniref:Glucuronyl hydrolase n=1 Tax=Cladophialophora chaetospira TaxID=386627 RepID=A0AA38X3U1_9EURO|nr:hypothetical protein H2200_009295 [Cladophialophora chaetospira]